MRTLIENTFALSTKVLRKDLKKARNKELVSGEYLNFRHNGKPSALDYSIEYSFDGNTYLVINFDGEPQKILLSTHELTFGTRTYLTCGCSKRTNALYLKNTFFACFECSSLRYGSTSLNRRSDHGRMLYQQSKRLKLMDMREKMDRIFYKSKYTKRFEHWKELCRKAGFTRQVSDAELLMDAIIAYQQLQQI